MNDIPSIDFLVQIFSSSGDEVFIVDFDGNITYKNEIAGKKYPKIKNINKISHLFNFEICILKSEDILTYNPISAALSAKEFFFANITKQINEKFFVDYSLTSIPVAANSKIIILKNNSNDNLLEQYETLETKSAELEDKVISAIELKSKLENQLLRTNLINLVSEKVQELIDTKKIIKIVLEQLRKILDITKAEFLTNADKSQTKISSEIDEKQLITKLFVPVFQDKKVFGVLVLHRKNSQNTWQKDEIDLVKNISSLLATSFSKEELFEKLEEQKKELEKTLEQLKSAQLQIVQSEKMAALGQLVAGVAHEINTPLGAIAGNLDLLLKLAEKSSEKNDLIEMLKEISPVNKEAIRRIDHLVKSLKNFTRLDEAKKKEVDIKDGIVSSIELISHETRGKIKIVTDFADLPKVSCYPDYINQVFMNILLNACQSIKGEGEIRIKTVSDGDFVCVSFVDNGSGIAKENLSKIFDFGFTTKKIGQGTGLGLALAKKIIDEHKGKITVDSKLGEGTTFNIYLPVHF